jgi:hypothetical protein
MYNRVVPNTQNGNRCQGRNGSFRYNRRGPEHGRVSWIAVAGEAAAALESAAEFPVADWPGTFVELERKSNDF